MLAEGSTLTNEMVRGFRRLEMRRRVRQVVLAVLLASSYVFGAATTTSGSGPGGQVLHVPSDYPTIQAALDAAAEGDTVQVKAGVYNENVVVSTSGVKVHGSAAEGNAGP